MTPKRKQRIKIVLFVVLFATVAVGLLVSALGQNMNHYYELSEIKSAFQKDDTSRNSLLGKTIRIGGMLQPHSVKRTEGTLKVSFVITNFTDSINVSYEGILPDLFKEGKGVLAKGKLVDADHLIAEKILAKHDENYMPKEVKAELEKVGLYQHTQPQETQPVQLNNNSNNSENSGQ